MNIRQVLQLQRVPRDNTRGDKHVRKQETVLPNLHGRPAKLRVRNRRTLVTGILHNDFGQLRGLRLPQESVAADISFNTISLQHWGVRLHEQIRLCLWRVLI